jgi:methylmalonyl-CoA mutase cobalamin-binding subunit
MSRTIIVSSSTQGLALDISGTERETGISKDLLRMWERRYGFPKPMRDGNGERRYSAPEVAKLRAIKRLMDTGIRPGKIVLCTIEDLNLLGGGDRELSDLPLVPVIVSETFSLLQRHDAPGLRRVLADLLMRQGLQRFVLDTIAPLNRTVGEGWMRGELQIFEEHLYTEQLQVVLRTAINTFPRQAGTPRVLLTTFPGERHSVGLLMVEALLVPEGAQCIVLGVQTPPDDVRRAALAHDADIVALSFSGAYPPRQAIGELTALRRDLPRRRAIWAGGGMTGRLRRPLAGVELIPDLAGTLAALRSWRGATAAAATSAPLGNDGRKAPVPS